MNHPNGRERIYGRRPYYYERLPAPEFWDELRQDFRQMAETLSALHERFGRVEERVDGMEEANRQKAFTNRWVIGLLVTVMLGLLAAGVTTAAALLSWGLAHVRFY